ncbi:hypothetical protein MASR1M32_20000 [Rhodobacter sp.]
MVRCDKTGPARTAGRPARATLYAFFTLNFRLPHSALMAAGPITLRPQKQGTAMADIIYLALGLAAFGLFAGAVRLIDRM